MNHADQNKTVAINPCRSCGRAIADANTFCRWCGASQHLTPQSSNLEAPPDEYRTTRLDTNSLYHPVSAPLMRAVAAGVQEGSAPAVGNVSKRLLLALMALPIWVMIILLSPLDAYTSAKVITRRI